MKKIVESLEILKKDKKYFIKKGDVFVYKIPFEDFYRFGLVLGAEINFETWDDKKGEFGTIAFYNLKSKDKKRIPRFKNEDVIVYDISRVLKNKKAIKNTSTYPWKVGYFETVGNIEVTKDVYDFSDFCFWDPEDNDRFFDINGDDIKPGISSLWKLDKDKYNRDSCYLPGISTNPKITAVEVSGYSNPLPKDYDYILDLDKLQTFLYQVLEEEINFNLESEKILQEYQEKMEKNEMIEKELEWKILVILEIFAIAKKGRRKNLHGGLVRWVKSNKIKFKKEEKENYLKIIDYMLTPENSDTNEAWRSEEYRENWKKAMFELKERLK